MGCTNFDLLVPQSLRLCQRVLLTEGSGDSPSEEWRAEAFVCGNGHVNGMVPPRASAISLRSFVLTTPTSSDHHLARLFRETVPDLLLTVYEVTM